MQLELRAPAPVPSWPRGGVEAVEHKAIPGDGNYLKITPPPACMPESFRKDVDNPTTEQVVDMYRDYYRYKSWKLNRFTYRRRSFPDWLLEE